MSQETVAKAWLHVAAIIFAAGVAYGQFQDVKKRLETVEVELRYLAKSVSGKTRELPAMYHATDAIEI